MSWADRDASARHAEERPDAQPVAAISQEVVRLLAPDPPAAHVRIFEDEHPTLIGPGGALGLLGEARAISREQAAVIAQARREWWSSVLDL